MYNDELKLQLHDIELGGMMNVKWLSSNNYFTNIIIFVFSSVQ